MFWTIFTILFLIFIQYLTNFNEISNNFFIDLIIFEINIKILTIVIFQKKVYTYICIM